MKSKTLVIKTNTFPTVSETFIVSNIVEAIKQGYHVQIIASHKRATTFSSQAELFEKYQLQDKTNSMRQSPTKKYKRYLYALFCLLHPTILFYYLKLRRQENKKHLEWLYKLYFYRYYRKSDIIHVHFATAADVIPLFKKIGFIKSKVVVTFHGYDAHFNTDEKLEVLQKRYRLLFTEANSITVNTSYLAKKVEQLGCDGDRLQIIPMGIDLEFFQVKTEKKILKKSNINLISVGRLVTLKGFDYAIKSVKILVDNGYDVQYTIVGDGKEKDALLQLATDLKLTDHVFLVGDKNQKVIKEILESSTIFIMSSITDVSQRAEAQGVVTAEAQAMSLPVVAFKSGGVPDTILEGKTGFLVPEKDAEAMADAIQFLIEHPERYKTMSSQARYWAIAHFNRSKMISDYYDDLL